MSEPQYTLTEARRLLAQQECGMHGHLFTEIVTGTGEPVWVMCERCGKRWAVNGGDLDRKGESRTAQAVPEQAHATRGAE